MKKRNRDAAHNFEAGRVAFQEGMEEPVAVFRRFVETARGDAAARHWATGYRAAAAEARSPVADSLSWVAARRADLSTPERLRMLDIMIEAAGPRVSADVLAERDSLRADPGAMSGG